MSQALYRKWRPRLWDQVVGQDHVVRTLQNAIRTGRVGHAYLFAGPRGTGKTTTARLLAKAVNCLDPDVQNRPCDHCEHCQSVNDGRFLDLIEIDAASNTSVDDVRDLRDKINFSPTQGSFKVYIIDEVHMLSTAAFNALLKTLEEPPPHAIFILATTEMHKIPATVLSRCQRHEFRRIPVDEIVGQLKMLCQQEMIGIDEDALVLIARQSTGSMRDAISLLDQLSSMGGQITLETAQKVLGTATNQLVIELVDAILSHRADLGLNCIHRALDSGSDPRQFARQMVDYLRGLLLIRLGNPDQVEATPEVRQQMASHAKVIDLERLLDAIRLFNTAAADTRSGWQPGLLLELALAEAVEEKQAVPALARAEPTPQTPTPAPKASIHKATPSETPAPAARVEPAPEPEAPATEKPAAHSATKHPTDVPAKKGGTAQPEPRTQAQPEAVEPAPADPSKKYTFQDILHHWPRIRAVVKKARVQTEGLMNSCKPLAIKEGVLILGFSTDLLKKKMEAGDNVLVIRQGIYQVMGCEVPVACVVMNSKASTDLPSDFDVEGDGIVGTALNLGGKIVQKD
jgi:DNA polymerase-3 subunit gamma/tau